MKACSKCGVEKEDSAYDKAGVARLADGSTRQRVRGKCNTCVRDYRRLEGNRSSQKKYRDSEHGKKKRAEKYVHERDSGILRDRYRRHITGVLLRNARMRAKKFGLPFDLVLSDIVIPAVCPVLGIAITPGRGKRLNANGSPTVDRIVPALGYVRTNIAVISWRANRLKSDAAPEELLRVAQWAARSVNAAVERARRGESE